MAHTQKQAEAREHNYTKMVVAGASSNIGTQIVKDVRLTDSQRVTLNAIVDLLRALLNDWEVS